MLPQSLDETYERMLCNIESRDEAQQMLSLLCYASRPLSVDEVTEALAVDIDGLECYDPKSRFTGGADDLLRICPGLIEISLSSDKDNESDFDDQDDEEDEDNANSNTVGVQIVRIAHFSVQEYLLSERIRKSRAANFALSGPTEHGRISKACLLYLAHDDFLEQTLSADLVKQYAFAKYAAEHWHRHLHYGNHQLASQLLKRISTLLTTRHILERWITLYDPERPWHTRVNYEPVTDHPSPIYYASFLGLEGVLADVLSVTAADVNAQGGYYGYALQAASLGGHEKVVQILLETGAEANAQGGVYGTALQAASARGHEKVVQILLERGAEVNAQGGYYSTALQAASARGHEKVVQILLEKGAEVNTQGGVYGTALQAASARGHKKVVQTLVDAGAEASKHQ